MITPDQAWSAILNQNVSLPAVALKADEALRPGEQHIPAGSFVDFRPGRVLP